jgi:hypothetical protein
MDWEVEEFDPGIVARVTAPLPDVFFRITSVESEETVLLRFVFRIDISGRLPNRDHLSITGAFDENSTAYLDCILVHGHRLERHGR